MSQDSAEQKDFEDVYEYDYPRPHGPPAPARRTMSDVTGTSAAFSSLCMDAPSTIEACMCLTFAKVDLVRPI